MPAEIERKFLIHIDKVRPHIFYAERITQGYLNLDPARTVRVRLITQNYDGLGLRGPKAFMTVKGLTQGMTREEHEFEIPYESGLALIGLCHRPVVEKSRYAIGRWEIDLFHGPLEGLALAEIELSSEDEDIGDLPDWIDREVTGQAAFYNSCLSQCTDIATLGIIA